MCQQIPRRKPVNGFGIAGAKRHSLIRLASTAALVVLTVVGSAPPVQADPPTRIVLPPIAPPLLIPAGQGCAFDVLELRDDQNARIAITLFDARVMTNAEATPTFVNLETEASLDHHSTYTSVQTLDPTASTVHVEISGTIFIWLRPGNEGPSGTVEHPGAVLSVTGRQAFVYDIAADRIISYESSGSVTDLCEQLAA